MSGLHPLEPHPLAYDKPLCASLGGFTLHGPAEPSACPGIEPRLVRIGPDGEIRTIVAPKARYE